MKFCKYCGSLLAQESSIVKCISCNKECSDIFELSSKETFSQKPEVDIISEKDSVVLPKVEHTCERCGSNSAYFWHANYIGDEADTIFHKCTECGLTTQSGGQRGGR